MRPHAATAQQRGQRPVPDTPALWAAGVDIIFSLRDGDWDGDYRLLK